MTDKRYEYSMLDIDKMESDIDALIKKAIEDSKNKYEGIDKEALISNLYADLKEKDFGQFENELIKFKDEIINNGLSEEEYNEIINKLEDMTESINNTNSRLDKIEDNLKDID